MFYSQLLLSKKGALGIVWLAAHCHKRLKKDQIQRTNVSSSVDKILDDEVPAVTHRILAFLLLGVVRIYSEKVEYLFHDCYEVLNKLLSFRIARGKRAIIGASSTHYHSIILPKRFELDAFDLEQSEHQDFVGEKARLEEPVIIVEGGCQKDGDAHDLVRKVVPFSEASSTDCTPPRDVFSPHHMDKHLLVWPSINMNSSLAGGANFCLEDQLDPMVLDEAEEGQLQNKKYEDGTRICSAGLDIESDSVANLSNRISHSAPSLEIVRGSRFSLEGHPDSMALDEPEIVQTDGGQSMDNVRTNLLGLMPDVEFDSVARPSPQGSNLIASSEAIHESGFTLEHSPTFKMLNETDNRQGLDEQSGSACEGTEKQVDHDKNLATVYENGPPRHFTYSVNKAQSKVTVLAVNTPKNQKSLRTVELPISVVTPHSKIPDANVSIPGVASVQTPAAKEHAKIQKKRKTLFDETTVLSNKVLKKWVEEDPSDLKRRRRKVPLTVLHAWRVGKLGRAPKNFLEPLVSGMSVNLSCLGHEKTCPVMEMSRSGHEARSPDDVQVVQKQIPDVVSPEQSPIAPGTPVTNLNEARTIVEQTISPGNIEKQATSYAGLEFDSVFQEETSSFDKDSLETDALSARTRVILQHLRWKFLDKNGEEKEQVLSLSQLLQGKTKRESASLFYEILVLKTRDCIDVEQANGCDDILLRPKEVKTGIL